VPKSVPGGTMYFFLLALVVALLAYLLIAVVRPERF
jgi:K+-transporting ATPase KdpF subunit